MCKHPLCCPCDYFKAQTEKIHMPILREHSKSNLDPALSDTTQEDQTGGGFVLRDAFCIDSFILVVHRIEIGRAHV